MDEICIYYLAKITIFIYLFIDAVGSWDHVTSNDTMIDEFQMT
jgi:hypothetical protein